MLYQIIGDDRKGWFHPLLCGANPVWKLVRPSLMISCLADEVVLKWNIIAGSCSRKAHLLTIDVRLFGEQE